MTPMDIGLSASLSSAATAGAGAFNVSGGGGDSGGAARTVPAWIWWAVGGALVISVGALIFTLVKKGF